MSLRVRQQLETAEEDLLCAMSEGDLAVEAFSARWSELNLRIDDAAEDLDDDTLSLLYAVASRIEIISGSFLQLREESETLGTQLMHDLERILDEGGQSTNNSHADWTTSSRTSDPSSPTDVQPTSRAAFACYKWLIKNIHNPYPDKDMKEAIAADSSSSISSIDTWFQNARRKIGWTALSRKYFDNSRIETVKHASQILLEETVPAMHDLQLTHEFLEMKAKAQTLCSQTFKKSRLARELDVAVKDMSEDFKKSEARRRRAEEVAHKKRDKLEKELGRIYKAKERTEARLAKELPSPSGLSRPRGPSPALSRTPSLTLSQSSESDEEVELPEYESSVSTKWSDRKRRSSSCTSEGYDAEIERPLKRPRSDPSQVRHSVEELTIPPGTDTISDLPDVEVVYGTPVSHTGRITTKRRLSDTITTTANASKRQRSSLSRHHVVPDPLSYLRRPEIEELASTWNWENIFTADVPPQVTIGGLDNNADLDIQLFTTWPTLTDNEMTGLTSAPSLGTGEAETTAITAQEICLPSLPLQANQDLDVSTMAFPDLFSDYVHDYSKSESRTSTSHQPASTYSVWDHLVGDPSLEVPQPVTGGSAEDVDLSRLLCEPLSQEMHRSECHLSPFDSNGVVPLSPNAQAAALLSLDQQVKLQQYFVFKEAAAQIERELLIV